MKHYLDLLSCAVNHKSKYWKWYSSLINRAITREKPCIYCEKHHIAPKSIVGKNNGTVWLTAREHFIAHAFLVRCCVGEAKRSMQRAFHAIIALKHRRKGYLPRCSIFYATSREQLQLALKGRKNTWTKGTSDLQKQTLAKLNRDRVWTEEQREKLRIACKARTGAKHTFETRQKMSASARARSSFTLNGVKYETVEDACFKLKLKRHAVVKLKKAAVSQVPV